MTNQADGSALADNPDYWDRFILKQLNAWATYQPNIDRRFWPFTWNKQLSDQDNFRNILGEKEALARLSTKGFITVEVVDINDRSHEDWRNLFGPLSGSPLSTARVKLPDSSELQPIPFRIIVSDLKSSALLEQFKIRGLDPDSEWNTADNRKLLVAFDFINHSTPAITIANQTYTFSGVIHESTAFNIIKLCLEEYPGQAIELKKLLRKLDEKKVPLPVNHRNIRQLLRRSVFDKRGIFADFIEASPGLITVYKERILSVGRISEIIKLAD